MCVRGKDAEIQAAPGRKKYLVPSLEQRLNWVLNISQDCVRILQFWLLESNREIRKWLLEFNIKFKGGKNFWVICFALSNCSFSANEYWNFLGNLLSLNFWKSSSNKIILILLCKNIFRNSSFQQTNDLSKNFLPSY